MGMTIDEAIKHCEEVANRHGGCKECADEHRQLAEWLGELQKITEIVAKWKVDTWTDNFSYECMSKIAEIIDKYKEESEEK